MSKSSTTRPSHPAYLNWLKFKAGEITREEMNRLNGYKEADPPVKREIKKEIKLSKEAGKIFGAELACPEDEDRWEY